MTARRRAALALLLLSGCASPRESLDVAGGLAAGMLEGAGRGALGGLRIVAESRCDRRECLAIVPLAAGVGALAGGVTGAAQGMQTALARRSERRNDALDAGLGVRGDVDADGVARRLEGGELAVEE